MRLAVAFSSKEGLEKEYREKGGYRAVGGETPQDFFAEGDSDKTLNALMSALRESGHDVHGFESDDRIYYRLKEFAPELVFNIAEGLFGDFRESYVPLVCERLGVPYSGSGPLTLALCLNKARTKEILSFRGIPNAPFRVFAFGEDIQLDDFAFPAIVKPLAEGSSKGIFDNSVVRDAASAKRLIGEKTAAYGQSVILEQFLDGDEFTVAMWGNGDEVEVLPIVGINYNELPSGANKIYSYEAKWLWDTPEKPLEIFTCPARIDAALRAKIEKVAIATYRAMEIRDWCRIDIRLDAAGVPNVLELNPLPGVLPDPKDNSCFPKAARAAGYDYARMLDKIVQIAARRYNPRRCGHTHEKEHSCSSCL